MKALGLYVMIRRNEDHEYFDHSTISYLQSSCKSIADNADKMMPTFYAANKQVRIALIDIYEAGHL